MIRGLAVSNIAWSANDEQRVCEFLRARGVEAVELAPTKRWEKPLQATTEELKEYRAEWEKRGFRIVALQALLYGRPDLQLFGDANAMREYLVGIIRVGGALGAKALVFGSPKNRLRGSMAFGEAITIAAEFFRSIAPIAEDAGTTICFEPNPAEYGCDFVTTIHEAISLARFVDHPAFRVQGDLGELTYEFHEHRGLSEVVKRAAPYLGHFHLSEPDLLEVGAGGADLVGGLEGLTSSSYSGWVSIEMKETSFESLQRSVKVVQRYLDASVGGFDASVEGAAPT